NKPSSSEKSKTESPGTWLFKAAKKRKKEWLQQQLDLRRSTRASDFTQKEETNPNFKSSDSRMQNNSSDTSVRSLKRRRKLPSGQRMFDKRNYKINPNILIKVTIGKPKNRCSKYHPQSKSRRKGKKKKVEAQLKREKEWISKHSSDILTNNKARRNSLERTNQKSIKIFPLSRKMIKSAKSGKRTVRTSTSEKENLRNLQKFDRTSNYAFGNVFICITIMKEYNNTSEKASVNQNFMNKLLKNDVRKSNWTKEKKLESLEGNLNSNSRRSHKNSSSYNSKSSESKLKEKVRKARFIENSQHFGKFKTKQEKTKSAISRQKGRQLIGSGNAWEDVRNDGPFAALISNIPLIITGCNR
uniref:Translocon at the inner envelope membrane of chloroplasts 214 n=1 Tax=Brugia timori TaxID=42155 RepID=A0A0R3QP82_9BILA